MAAASPRPRPRTPPDRSRCVCPLSAGATPARGPLSGLLLDTDLAAFACTVLESLGWPARPLRAASGWSNHVWLAPAHVVRISSGRFRDPYCGHAQAHTVLCHAHWISVLEGRAVA